MQILLPLEDSPFPRPLHLQPLPLALLPQVLELDRRCLGGLWSEAGYRRELESDQSELWVLTTGGIVQASQGAQVGASAGCCNSGGDKGHGPGDCPGDCGLDGSIQVIAMACLWAILDEAHVTLLAVDPDWRRQGLGQYLLWAILGAARSRQLSWAALEVRVSNQVALDLYGKFGFQSIGRRRRYYQDTGEDAAILWLKGLQTETFSQSHHQRGQQIHQHLQQAGWQPPTLAPCLEKYASKS